MGEITDHVVAYSDGHITFEALCAYLATFPYRSCPRFGIWQMWAGPGALDNSTQELRIAALHLLTDDEYLAVIEAIKNRQVSVHETRDVDHGDDGEQPTTE
jgi:hypothetical protein